MKQQLSTRRRAQLRPWFCLLPAILVGLIVALPRLATAGAAPPAAPPDTTFAAIDRFVEEQMEDARIPGLALGIVHGDQVVHLRGFGAADRGGRAVTPQTPFLIASVTKPLTALAIMQLAEAGRLDLDAPVQRYLPWFRTADEVASSRITLRHLLNHSGGLPTLTGHEAMLFERDQDDDALEQRVRALHGTPLSAEPGTMFQYSNAGYATLALVVEAVSGTSYEDYLEQHVYQPLQMQRSFASQAAAEQAGLASGYRYWFGRPLAFNWSYSRAELGAGFTYASAEDLTHFVVAQLNGGRFGDARIVSEDGIAALHQPAVELHPSGPWVDRESYGMGWFIREAAGVRTVSHSGVAPNFFADVVLVPDHKLGVVLLANGMNHLQPTHFPRISSGVTGMLVGADLAPAVSPNDPKQTLLNVVVGALLLQALGLAWTLWRQHAARPRPLWVSLVAGPLHLAWALLCLVVVPQLFRWPLSYLRLEVPDLGYALILSGSIALVWGILAPLLRVSRRRSASTASRMRQTEHVV